MNLMSPSYIGTTLSAPLWMNPNLPHFYSLPDPMVWASRGVKVLGDITREGELITFDQLKTQHNLSNPYFFQYLQRRHAFQTHFSSRRVEVLPFALEDLLMDEELSKPLSAMYKSFFKKTPPAVTRCREQRMAEIPEIQGEDWEDMWDHPFKHLLSARDRLIQFKFLHRIYHTPARLACIYPSATDKCWRCSPRLQMQNIFS